MTYNITVSNAELIVILAALGKQKAKYENLGMRDYAHEVSDVIAKLHEVTPVAVPA